MSDVAISVENLSKKFRIGTSGGLGYHRLSEVMTSLPKAAWNVGRSVLQRKPSPAVEAVQNPSDFWALKDVSFEVKQGEVVGIIGRNGAGKSTLLKILSRITEPTSGRFGVRGRVASLLEVGTGFHPELTGRENIYVCGITLGMTRVEIKKRFDEIVAFSGVEKFLDTPVKRYSSGMQVRLGFAVAAHLECEILIVDEVLAVGDADFQKRCLARMNHVASSGRTILIVSHDLASIESIADRGLILKQGGLTSAGNAAEVVSAYLRTSEPSQEASTWVGNLPRRNGFDSVIQELTFRDAVGKNSLQMQTNAQVSILIRYRHDGALKSPSFGATFVSESGVRVIWVNSSLNGPRLPDLPAAGIVECNIPSLPLLPGTWRVEIGCKTLGRQIDLVESTATIKVQAGAEFENHPPPRRSQACVWCDATWKLRQSI